MSHAAQSLASVISLRRLVAGAAVLGVIIVPLLLFVLPDADDGVTRGATLLDTPPTSTVRAVGIDAGKLAPEFEVSSPDGSRVRLSDLRGRPVIINFWSTWCTSCLTEMPEIKALQEEKGLDAFAVLAINAGESLARAQEFIDFLDAPFVYGLDPNLVVADAYSVYGLPLSVFIDAEGVVQAVYRGHADRDRLDTFLTAAIEAKPPGPLPPVLRIVTTIPRDRLLFVVRESSDELIFRSRSLRCDSAYCADGLVADLSVGRGIVATELSSKRQSEPTLSVRFDPRIVPESEVVSALASALGALPDPVYDRPLEVRYLDQ